MADLPRLTDTQAAGERFRYITRMADDPQKGLRTVLKRSVVAVLDGRGVRPPLIVQLLGPSGEGSDYVAELKLAETCVVRVEVTALLRALTPETGPS